MNKAYITRIPEREREIPFLNLFLIFFTFLILFPDKLIGQVSVAPLSCYPQYGSASAMDAAAVASSAATPFATWKGAYDYAIANGINTIDFVTGTYDTDLSGSSTDWGSADGGFVLASGMTVNGNGSVINNTPNVGSGQLCFATLSSNSTVDGFVFKQMTGNPSGGALFVPSSADNWTISNCDFNNCNQGTDALIVNLGATSTGNITACNFYGNSNPGATYPASPGLPSSSALVIEGSLTSDLNITNSTFSCNFRNVSGGAVKIQDDVHVDFSGCTFYRNEANSSRGGAIDIGSNAEVTFTNTSFLDNFTSGSGSPFGGALAIQSGSDVTITNCFFKGNSAVEDGGAIYLSGGAANTTTTTITGTIFEENSNTGGLDGGAIYVQNYTNTTISNCLFYNNTSGDKGAAVYVDGSSAKDLDILSSTFTGNNAGLGEGTIHVAYLNTDTDVFIDNCVIADNNSAEDVESEYTPTPITTIQGSYYNNLKGGITDGGGNTSPYTPTFDADYNDSSGAGWTGTYSSPTGSGTCPSPPTVSNDCTDQGSISGVAFDDSNNVDGINDGTPLAGVLVELFSCDGTNTGIFVVTGSDGAFFFGGLDNGACYYLQFTPPGGFDATYQDASGSTATNDSDVNISTGQSPQITINTAPNSVDNEDDITNETHYVSVDAGFTSIPLPVELISFQAREINCQTELKWCTASELNNDFFEVQKSEDGRNFETISIIRGAGTSSVIQNYKFIDEETLGKRQYYRLLQVDFDGTHSTSQIVGVDANNCLDNITIGSIFPNPFIAELQLEVEVSQYRENVFFEIYNLLGQRLVVDQIALEKGKQIVTINTRTLTNGTYFIHLKTEKDNLLVQKIIKR